ncbi:MAG: acyltransferase family protein [Actinomycetota bacterium]
MPRPPALGYQPGIDGLRALAVSAVVMYHAQQNMPSSWLPGGFLGVEVFFAISGYLITTLIAIEHERTGTIDVRRFWVHRARRLLPALLCILVVTVAIVGVGGRFNDSWREHVGSFRAMWLSAWVYFTNWYQIIAGLDYGASVGRPPLLRHLWSLAVEEQFYIFWPMVLWVLLRCFRSRSGQRGVGFAFALLAAATAAATALLYQPTNLGRINVLYLSTPTRASGLLLGAALALLWQPWRNHKAGATHHGRLMDLAGAIGLGVLAWSFLRWHLTVEGEAGTAGYDLLFRGGFLLIDAATLLLVVTAMHPGSFLGRRVLGSAPLVWIGKRSYGLYLWHWPVFQLTRPLGDQSLLDVTTPDLNLAWLPVLVIRLLITLVLTELSYRFLEMPIRHGALNTWWRSDRQVRLRRTSVAAAVCLPLLALVTVATTMSFGATDQLAADALCNERPEACGEPEEGDSDGQGLTIIETTEPSVADPPSDTTGGRVDDTAPSIPTSSVAGTAGTTTVDPAPSSTRLRSNLPALVIGDSVMFGASGALRRAGLVVDVRINRGFAAAYSLVLDHRRQRHLGDIVVLGLGTAGGISKSQVTKLMSALTSVPHVVFITPQAGGRSFELRSREVLLQAVSDYPNVSVIDWQQIAEPLMKFHEGASGVSFNDLYSYRDKVHLVANGRRFYGDLIIAEVRRLSAPGPGPTSTA